MTIWFRIDDKPYLAIRHTSLDFAVKGGNSNHDNSRQSNLDSGLPVTVLTLGEDVIPDCKVLETEIERLLATDDVISPGFTKSILLANLDAPTEIGSRVNELCSSDGFDIYIVSTKMAIRSGPYYATSSGLHHVYKLEEDPLKAFMIGIISQSKVLYA